MKVTRHNDFLINQQYLWLQQKVTKNNSTMTVLHDCIAYKHECI